MVKKAFNHCFSALTAAGLILLAICLCTVASGAAPPLFVFEERVPGVNNAQIVTKAKINDRPISLILDTGTSSGILLFPTAARKLGLKIVEEPRYGPLPSDAYFGKTEPAKLEIGKKTFPEYEVPVFGAVSNGHDGLLGWTGMQENIWGFLLAAKQVMLLQEVPEDVKSWAKFSLVDQAPEDLSLKPFSNKKSPLRITVDTGIGEGVILPRKEWIEWKSQHPQKKITLTFIYFPSVDKLFPLELAWADEYQLGDVVIREVPISEAPPGFYSGAPGETVIALGINALKRLEMVIDPGNKLAFIQPVKAAPDPYSYNRIAAIFIPQSVTSEDLVAHVVSGGPAWKAGVRTGDVLISIDDQQTRGWQKRPELDRTAQWEAPAGTKFILTLRRKHKLIRAEVIAEEILFPKRTASTPNSP